jgi:hypothetical protein
VQALCQALCDESFPVTVVRECVQDVSEGHRKAMLDHLLPIYCDVISLSDFIDRAVGIDNFVEEGSSQSREALVRVASSTAAGSSSLEAGLLYCTDCNRRGHGERYMQFLLERPGWQAYPSQAWYGRGMTEYMCPLGKKVVDFADEPEFSKVAMFIAGREWLDEKDKVKMYYHFAFKVLAPGFSQSPPRPPLSILAGYTLCWEVYARNILLRGRSMGRREATSFSTGGSFSKSGAGGFFF